MIIERRASAWRSIVVAADAWQREDTEWDRRVLFALLEATGTCPSPTSSSADLVRVILPEHTVRSVELVGVTSTGTLTRRATDSPDLGLLAWTVACLWGHDSIVSALAQGEPMARYRVIDGSAEVHACIPLTGSSTPLEVVAVSLEARDADDAISCVSQLTLVGRLWCTTHRDSGDGEVLAPMDALDADSKAVLTARQQTILSGMAKGWTNDQIARSIGFSESTVRMESMSIYRHFGVHARLEAVAAARLTGDLAEEDIHHVQSTGV